MRALVRRDDAPALRLVESGRNGAPLPDAMLGLDAALRAPTRHRSRLPARALRWLGRGADDVAGGVDVFQRVRLDGPPVRRALDCLALSELPLAGPARDRVQRAVDRADGLLVFSQAAAERARGLYGQAPERVQVVPVGCEHWLRELDGDVEPAAPGEVLVLGAPRPVRGHALILSAVERLRAGGLELRLRCVGRPPEPGSALARALGDEHPALVWQDPAGDPAERDLPRSVARASLLVHLAADELSAVTPLEACACGLPVVVSDLPAFAEALGAEGRRVPVGLDDVDVLADAMAAAVAERGDASAVARRQALAARWSWDAAARATSRAWVRLLAAR